MFNRFFRGDSSVCCADIFVSVLAASWDACRRGCVGKIETARLVGRLVLCIAAIQLAAVSSLAASESGDAEGTAQTILKMAGFRGGVIVHVGCDRGELTAALYRPEGCVVHGLDSDAADVEAARRYIQSRGIYGPVSADWWSGDRLPYADNLVNLLVVTTPRPPAESEAMRVLVPGGVLLVGGQRGWTKRIKPRPDDIDDWTHWMHGPDNNAVARDRRVGPPRYLQWKAEPVWSRSHDGVPDNVSLVLSAGGRLFGVIDEGLIGQPDLPARWTLVARDAFNGVVLWKRPLGRRVRQRELVAGNDRLYGAIGEGNQVMILDAASGRTVAACPETKGTRELVLAGDVLVAYAPAGRRPTGEPAGLVRAVDATTGQLRWEKPTLAITTGSLAAAGGAVIFHAVTQLVCLDLADGRLRWQATLRTRGAGWPAMIYRGVVLVPAAGGLHAFSLKDGKPLWTGPPVSRRLGMFGTGGLVWITRLDEGGRTFLWTPAPVEACGYDPLTGQCRRTVRVDRLVSPGHHIRCYPAKATER